MASTVAAHVHRIQAPTPPRVVAAWLSGPSPGRGAARRGLATALCLGLLATACGEVEPGAGSRVLTVFAAASLTEPFTTMGEDFEEETGATVEFNFAGSSELARQVGEGAPAGVLASADPATMDRVAEGELAGEPEVFAHNTLEIAVPPDNPAGVTGLADLARPEVTVALCAEEVPCGAAARRAMDASGIEIEPVTWENDVKAALTRVRLGEVDAALVYRTDILASGSDVSGIPFPEAGSAANDYLIAELAKAPDPETAGEFVGFVLSERGAEALAEAGFEVPG